METAHVYQVILNEAVTFVGKEALAVDNRPFDSWEAIRIPGEVYPRLQLRVVEVDGEHAIQNETGWDGYTVTPAKVLTPRFSSWEEARAVLSEAMRAAGEAQ